MKRLLIALAAAAAVSTASAIITDTQDFETSFDDFVAKGGVDESELAEYGEVTPSVAVPYPCTGFGEKYLSLDTGDATLWRTNAGDAAYIDMVMQFNPCTEAPTNAPGTKISVYLNSTSNLVVQAGDGAGGSSNYVTSTTLAPGTWARLTVASNGAGFDLYLDGTQIGNTYPSLTGDATICEVGFSGSGKLDDFVARTTDPYYSGDYVARIGTGEFYSTYSEALADALATTTQDAATIITRSNDQTSNGSESSPYRIEDAACLVALQNAVLVNPAVRSLHYVQTADIDMSAYDGFTGIGTTNTDSASGGVPFSGTYDGAGHKISNVKFSWRKYAGIFNQVNCATIKNLIGENLGFSETGSGEHGCAMVGNGIANLVALHSQYTVDFSVTNTHNAGGIMVRAMGGTTFTSCTNTADLVCCRDKMGGICCFDAPAANTTVAFVNCVNTGSYTLVTPPAASTYLPGNNGFAGILGYSQGAGNTTFQGCENTGSFVNNLDTTQFDNEVRGGELLGFCHSSGTISDLGGNKFNAANKAVHSKDAGTVGFAYATVDNGVATTVTTLAKDTTYLLTWDVAASETPVFTLAAVGDTIAFNTNGFNFAGTVAAAGDMVDAVPSTVDAVITYTATEAPTVATITKSGVTTPYRTLQDAIAAAESDDTVNLVGAAAGAVNIPAGITVQLVNGYSLNDVTSLAGEGVLKMPWGESPQPVHQLLCQQTTWAGTLYIQGVDISSAINLTLLGNVNSTVCFNNAGCAFTTGSTTAHAIKALEIGPNGLDFVGNYGSGTFTFPCALTGTGMLKIAVKDSAYGTDHKVAKFTGDVSGFAGSISFDADANCAVYFGEAAGNGNCISVAAGSAVTVAAGKTWTAPSGFVVQGNMTVNGTLNAGSEKLYGNGTITFNAATSLIVANTWTGTYNANFKAANNAIFYVPVNASATTVINGANGEFGGYPNFGGAAPTIAGEVVLNANWTIDNGWHSTPNTTKFAKLSGSGNLTVNGTTSGHEPIYYDIAELDNYTGTLGGNRGNFMITNKVSVTVDGTLADGACIVRTSKGVDGAIVAGAALWINGADSGEELEWRAASGDDPEGLYVKASAPVVVPTITPSASGSSDCGSAENATAAADAINAAKSTYIKALSASELSGEAAATYANLFTARADGTSVVVELNADGTNALETAATSVVAQVAEDLSTVAATANATTVSVTGAQPGFYYSVVYSADLSTLEASGVEGDRAMAGADGSVTLSIPAKAENAQAGFYRVKVSVQAAD